MKSIKHLLLILAMFGLVLTGRVTAQTFKLLHDFAALNNNTNCDGANPRAVVILSGNTLYGTTEEGGSSGNGTVFAINTDGAGFTNLHNFTATATMTNEPVIQEPQVSYTNSDGANPRAGLLLVGNTLYGTAAAGGTNGDGTIFAVDTNGTDFTTLYNFTGGGSVVDPRAGLIYSGTNLYGTASSGLGGGVFAINTNGTGYTVVHAFTGEDGAYPVAPVILSGNVLYGTTEGGGSAAGGTVFAVDTADDFETWVYSFTQNPSGTNDAGFLPFGGLVLSGDVLYGTASSGGNSLASGTVFAINTDDLDYTTLHEFALYPSHPPGTNSDGAGPVGGLVLVGDTLYGTTSVGGINGSGTIFSINTNGLDFKTVYNFTASHTNSSSIYSFTNSDGAFPGAGLLLSGCTLYGTTSTGGSAGSGTVFSLSFPPQLTISISGTNVILTWPTKMGGFDYSGFTLQSSSSLGGAPVWNSVFPDPIVVQGQNTVTNAISSTQQFYRLTQSSP